MYFSDGAIDPTVLQLQLDQLVSDMSIANNLLVDRCPVGAPCFLTSDQAVQFANLFVNAQNLQTDLRNLRAAPTTFDPSTSDGQLQLVTFRNQFQSLRDAFNKLPFPIKSTSDVPTGNTFAGTVIMWAGITAGIALVGVGVHYLWTRSGQSYRRPQLAGRRRRVR